jgi:hypothetical protein
MAMRGHQTEAAHYREIADKIRGLASEAPRAEIVQDLLDLAARLDRMAELSEKCGEGPAGKGSSEPNG